MGLVEPEVGVEENENENENEIPGEPEESRIENRDVRI